jgi:hypothetical protein
MDQTRITGGVTGLTAAVIKPGNYSILEDLHIDLSGNRGVDDGTASIAYGKGSTDTHFHHATIRRVRITNYSDGIYITAPDAAEMGLTVDDCDIETNIDGIIVTGGSAATFFVRVRGGSVTLFELNPEESGRSLVAAPWSELFGVDIRDLGTEASATTLLYDATTGRLIGCSLYSTSAGAVHIDASGGIVTVSDTFYDASKTSGTVTRMADPHVLGPTTAGRTLGINASGHVSRVTLVDTTTVNTDMLTAAGIRTAVGLGSANLDTQLADLPTVAEFNARTLVAAEYGTAASLTTIAGYLDTEIAAIKAKTDQFVFTVANKVDAVADATLTQDQIDDIAEGVAAGISAGMTPAQEAKLDKVVDLIQT